MTNVLGHHRFGAYGGDIGSHVTGFLDLLATDLRDFFRPLRRNWQQQGLALGTSARYAIGFRVLWGKGVVEQPSARSLS